MAARCGMVLGGRRGGCINKRRVVLSGFVLIGSACVLFTGRWLRTAVAGVWAICLVVVLGIPDGIWGTGLERLLIGLAVLVAVGSTLALVITVRAGLGPNGHRLPCCWLREPGGIVWPAPACACAAAGLLPPAVRGLETPPGIGPGQDAGRGACRPGC